MSAKFEFDVPAVAAVQRQRPEVVAGSRSPAVDDLVAPVVVVRVDAGVEVAQRQHHRAGQRRDVDQMRRALLARVPERVGEHEPALGSRC